MSKQGWTYKKLGDYVIEYSVKNKTKEDIPVYSVTNSQGFCKEYFSKEVASQDKSTYKIVPFGFFAYNPSRINVGSIDWQRVEEKVIVSPLYNVFGVSENLLQSYLLYFLKSPITLDYINKIATGTVRLNLKFSMLKEFSLPVPSVAEQERIVDELDLLSGIIEKKKEQLKAYDQLAQSIFYTMFGDPITNEKGWEVKKLEKVSTLINGRAYKQNELLNEGKYKVLRVGNFFTNSNFYYSDLELEENKYCDNGDLLFAWSASFGAFIWDGEKVIYHYHIWKVLYDEQLLNKTFYCYLLNTMTNAFMNDVHGIGMVHLTKQGMEQYDLPLPPLALQEEFAAKIEAIEQQKALVQQSIAEVQTLFDSRMDYWFG